MVIDPGNINNAGKIGKNGGAASGAVAANGAKVRPSDAERAPAAATESPASSQVSLSSQAQTISRLEKAAQQTPDVDHDKVAAIRDAIAEGRYNIDNNKLAERLLGIDSLF